MPRVSVLQFPARPGTPTSAKLELLEFLLGCEDPVVCAQRVVDWLHRKAGVAQAVCIGHEADPERLVTLGASGRSIRIEEEFSIAIEDRENPLTALLGRRQPVYFPRGAKQPVIPLDLRGAFHVLPLRAEASKEERAVGLLLVSARVAAVDPEVRWAGEILGEKLARLRSRDWLASSRGGRERSLLLGIINAVTDPILLTSAEGRLLLSNARAEKLFAAPDDASEGRHRAVALNNMLFSAALSSSVMEQEITRRELVLVDPLDGNDLLFELLATPVADPWNESCVISILRNVTDLGRAYQQLEENYGRLRTAEADVQAERHRIELVMDSVADPILVTDSQGDIVMLNDPAEKLFTLPETTTEEMQRRVRSNDAHFSSFVSNLLFGAEGTRHRGEIALIEPVTGQPMPVEALAGKVESETGELTWVVTILHDRREAIENARLYEQVKQASAELAVRVEEATTELVEQNELLRRQAIELEQASASKSHFLANVSHELRTPLNAILGYTSMLIQGVAGGPPNAQQKRALTRVDSNGRHLLNTINEVLDITRIEAGKMPLHLSEFDLDELLREVTAELEPIIARSRLEVSAKLVTRMPKIRSDRQKVKQVVLNLFSNALKFTHEGSVKITASFNPRRKTVTLSVADTGIGIDPENHGKVFEDFRQVDNSPTRQYGGTGLGLSICKRLAEILEGHITLDSQLGQGSIFSLHLPVRTKR